LQAGKLIFLRLKEHIFERMTYVANTPLSRKPVAIYIERLWIMENCIDIQTDYEALCLSFLELLEQLQPARHIRVLDKAKLTDEDISSIERESAWQRSPERSGLRYVFGIKLVMVTVTVEVRGKQSPKGE
jgi:hypothetical protein